MSTSPVVFISYSHDSELHKKWVLELATRLRNKGVDARLDVWLLRSGVNLLRFMENEVANSDRVLVICTDNYNDKSNKGVGGVGYENQIITAELFSNQNTTKFIPIIKAVTSKDKTPRFLGGRVYIDFSDETKQEEAFETLLREIHEAPANPIPPLGKNPFYHEASFVHPSDTIKQEGGTGLNLLLAYTQAKLSEEARTLLNAAAVDQEGVIMKISALTGAWIQVGEACFGDGGGGREETRWMSALEELERWQYIVNTENSDAVSQFKITKSGWDVSDLLLGTRG